MERVEETHQFLLNCNVKIMQSDCQKGESREEGMRANLAKTL